MKSSELFKDAPRFLVRRYYSINRFVKESLLSNDNVKKYQIRFNTETERKIKIKQINMVLDEATLVVFFFLVKRTFEDGSAAAKRAVDTFKSLGVERFNIGNITYEGRNTNVVMGDHLATSLMNSIKDDKIFSIVSNSKYISQIIDIYRNTLKKLLNA